MNKQRTSDKEREAAYKRDSKLVREVLSGNTSAFAELMSLYKKRIEALGMSFFKNPADTEDFAQDVFLKAYTKLDSFRGESLFSTWLTRMATAVSPPRRPARARRCVSVCTPPVGPSVVRSA